MKEKEKKRREEVLMSSLKITAKNNNKQYLNKHLKILIEGKKKDGHYFGKTETGKVVKFRINDSMDIGAFVMAKIIKIDDFGMEGILFKKI